MLGHRVTLLLLLGLLGGRQSGWAQLTESDTLPVSWQLSASGNWLTGNVERLLLVGAGDLALVGPRWALRAAHTYQYGTFGARTTERDWVARHFVYYQPRRRVYPYLMAWLESNRRRDLGLRYQLGPGFSWLVWKQAHRHSLKASFTLTYEESQYRRDNFTDLSYAGSRQVNVWRSTFRLLGQHHWPKWLGLRLQYACWLQPALATPSGASLLRWHTDVALVWPLARQVAWRISYNYTYERLTLAGVSPHDGFLVFGLTYRNNTP